MIFSVRFSDEEYMSLQNFMNENNINNKSKAFRKALEIANKEQDNNSFLKNVDDKLNRIIYNETIIKKLLEQFFANTGFSINSNPKNDKTLQDFYEKNYSRKNNFLG